ncbi:MAG: hypothetical protein HRT44_05360 [Bdellovibrionales bacterium]|nr:hypothetical protein [Bdellovibrionales bacterium]NQZ18670.1 hypothetical protein [Bdellovibrionales bacterium]
MKIFGLLLLMFAMVHCSTNPHKAEEIDTSMEKEKALNDEQSIGVKEGNLVYQKKVDMAEELRRLQINVYSLEDRVYGNRKYGSSGLYGVLKKCRSEVVSPENGGDGKLMWTEPMDRVTDKEDEFKIGYNDKDQIVGVSQEFLKDRIARFKKYKNVLQKREDEYKDKVDICEAKLKNMKFKNKKSAKSE